MRNFVANHKLRDRSITIEGIIFCEFDVKLGPVIRYQHPRDIVSKDAFESLSVYLIPKAELHFKIITINAFGQKVLGYPVVIHDTDKYVRNELIFNVAFIFSEYSKTAQYTPIIQKLACYLIDLEKENAFVSQKNPEFFDNFLLQIKNTLNDNGLSIIPISNSTTVHLKVAKVKTKPVKVEDYHVPIVVRPDIISDSVSQLWDLTTQKILNHIDGLHHISRIAIEADFDLNLVKACIQNLIYCGFVTLLPIFQYSNVYITTPKVRTLMENTALQQECITYVHKLDSPVTPSIRQILLLYSNMCLGNTVKDLCHRFKPHSQGVDERKLITYGIMRGFIRKIQKFPVALFDGVVNKADVSSYFNGNHSYDQICCELQMDYETLDEHVESNPSAVVFWK